MASNPLGLEVDWRGGVTGGSMGLAPQNSPAQCRIILIKKNTLGVEKKKAYNQSKMNPERDFFFFLKNSVLPVKWEKIHFFPVG